MPPHMAKYGWPFVRSGRFCHAHSGRFAALFAAIVASVLFLGSEARSFCRTTTCDARNGECPGDASHCVTEGFPLYWPTRCITFNLQENASRRAALPVASRIAEAAFAAWRNVTCPSGGSPSLDLFDLGPVSCDQVQYNPSENAKASAGNANIIIFRDSDWNHPDELDGTLALTTVTFSEDDGAIYDADMEINGALPLSTATPPSERGYDLQSIMTHEAGHFLGLAHSSDTRATMYLSVGAGTDDKRKPSADDVAGICSAYPPSRSVPACNPEPRHGFMSTCAAAADPKGAGCATEQPGAGGGGGCRLSAPGTPPLAGDTALGSTALGIVALRARRRRRRRCVRGVTPPSAGGPARR